METMRHSDPLEAWVDESIKQCAKAGYNPTIFIRMRHQHKTVPAMEQLVESGVIQSGFTRMKKLGMAKGWSVEAGILKFPDRSPPEHENARNSGSITLTTQGFGDAVRCPRREA
jgi:hypothetical protein